VDEGLDWTWAPIVIVSLLAVLFIVVRGIRPTAKVQVVMGIFEMAVFVVLAIHLLIIADNHTLDVFKPSTGNPGGMGDIFTAMIFGVLAYVGFESSTTLGEEARNPRRAIPLAVIGAVLVIGAFFTLCMYAGVVYWGPEQIEGGDNAFVTFNGGDPWDGIADRVWGGAWVFILIAILNSTWAGLLAEVNAASRVGYALGRVRILPNRMAGVHRGWRTPWIAATFVCLFGIAIALILGYALDGPGDALSFLVAIVIPMFCVIYGMTAISCIVFYWRQHRDEFNVLLHGVIPLAGALFFIPVLFGAIGVDLPYVDISGLVGAARAGPWIALGWLLIGLVAYYFFRTNRPESIEQLDDIFVHEDEVEDRPVTPGARTDLRV
jgi:amino acid transporter